MNILDFAIEKEKFSEHYYHELAEKTTNKGLKNICLMLAREETRHIKIVQEMQKKNARIPAETKIMKDVKNIFDSMKQAIGNFNFNTSEVELYQKARDIESKSREFYSEKAEEVEDKEEKKIFLKLADEEQKHYFIIDNICDFVARPAWFLENAEMYRFDDYDGGVL